MRIHIRRLLCLLLTLTLTLSALIRPALAVEEYEYAISDGEATITRYTGSSPVVHVPATLGGCPVTAIGYAAFRNLSSLEEVYLPEGLTEIVDLAFAGMTALTAIVIPETVTSIGSSAFSGCTSLVSVTLPAGLTSLGEYVFRNCASLRQIVIPEGITELPKGAFRGAAALTDITLPSTLTRIGSEAFMNCVGLTWFDFPASVEYAGRDAFSGCTSLTGFGYPTNPAFVAGGTIFAGCTGITSYAIPEGATAIPCCLFARLPNLRSVTIPQSVTAIGDQAFEGCTALTSITIPAGVTHIPQGAFSGCTALADVSLPDGLISIGATAFWKCTSLTHVTLPPSVTTLGEKAFYGCRNLTSVDLPVSWQHSGGLYIFGECPNLSSVTLPEGMTLVPDYAFSGCTGLTSLTLPSTVRHLGQHAFAECTSLTAIVLPDGLESTGYWTFSGCSSLTSINYPASLRSVGYEAFSGCDAIRTITVGEGVTHLPDGAFANMTSLTHVQLPSTLISIGNTAFKGCRNLGSINLPEGLLSIGEYAFFGCTNLEQIHLPSTVTHIGTHAFLDCSNLASVTLPAAWTDVTGVYYRIVPSGRFSDGRGGIFESCRLSAVRFPDGMTHIPAYALRGSTYLQSVTIPASVVSIGQEAFRDCMFLRFVSFLGDSCAFDAGVLRNSPDVTILCDVNSDILMLAIREDLPVIGQGALTADGVPLLRAASSLQLTPRGLSEPDMLDLTVRYALAEGVDPAGASIVVCLPSTVALCDDAGTLDGLRLDGRMLTLPVTASQGEIRCALRITGSGLQQTYAALQLPDGSTTLIGYHSDESILVSLSLPDTTATTDLAVRGSAPPESAVVISVNGVEAARTVANKAGSYSAPVTLPDASFGASFTVDAACTLDGRTCSASGTVLYVPGTPRMTGFTLVHGADSLDLLQAGAVPPQLIVVSSRFDYIITFDQPDQIASLWVTSTRNGETLYLEAPYNEELGAFITDGYFSDVPGYVPGDLNVAYTLRLPEVAVGGSYDWNVFTANGESLPSGAVLSMSDTPEGSVARIDLGQVDEGLRGIVVDAAISWLDDNAGTQISDAQGLLGDVETIFSYVVPGVDGSKYLVTMDYTDPYSYLMIVQDVSGSKGVSMTIDAALDAADDLGTIRTLSDISSALSGAGTIAGVLLDQHGIARDMDELRQEVLRTPYGTPEQRQEALAQVDALEFDKSMFTLMTALLPLMVVSAPAIGTTMTTAPYLMTGILSVFTSVAPLFWDLRTAHIRGQSIQVRYAIDPSGYVYDAVTQARLPGVTATAYYIPVDLSDPDFWSEPPSADEYGQLWNAAEFDQANPLTTNSLGMYAWDVPEGWWRVKYELDGYETAWSDWLPVPPPQTEVNIGLTPLPQAPAFPLWVLAIPAALLLGAAFLFLCKRRK